MSPRHIQDKLPNRPDFTLSQRRAALQTGFITDEQRARRSIIRSHAIDNILPTTPSDRDDAIFVETSEREGGYRDHITIADVAAAIPLTNPLASAAWKRAFTLYQQWGNDPMFVKAVEDRMSLEHQQERLGFTFSFDLDKAYKLRQLRFAPTITYPDNSDYAMAAQRVRTDPQFSLMAQIGKGIMGKLDNPMRELLLEAPGKHASNLTPEQFAITKMVEDHMLHTNIQVARFFAAADLPFVYRNFAFSNTDENGIARAYYSTEPDKHEHMGQLGLEGPYAHITSPIRRGPDYLNQLMLHYVYDLIVRVEEQCLALQPDLDRGKLQHALWQHATEWLHLAHGRQHDPHTKPDGTLGEKLAQLIHEAGGTLDARACEPIAKMVAKQKPPFTRRELQEHVTSINRLNEVEQYERRIRQREEREAGRLQQRIERMKSLDHTGLAADESGFTSLLRDAALSGILPAALQEEAEKRITQGRINPAQDGLSVMIIAAYPNDPAWISLKRSMSRAIKHNPAAVSNILTMAQEGGWLPGTLDMPEASLPIDSDQHLPTENHHIRSAVMVMSKENVHYSAPYYSLGHDSRSACSHAQYSFLEHYAFGQLQPLKQSAIPNALYAELGDSNTSRRSIIEKMISPLGARYRMQQQRLPSGETRIELSVQGGKIPNPITVEAASLASSPDELETTALRRLLRSAAFKEATKETSPEIEHSHPAPRLQHMLQPYEFLGTCAAQHAMHLSLEVPEERLRGGRSRFTAHIKLLQGDMVIAEASEKGPNKDRAIHDACTSVLNQQGWHIPMELATARAWVTDNESPVHSTKTTGTASSRTL